MYYIHSSKFKWNHYLLYYFLFNVIEGVSSKPKIAIIGAGIGGTSCAYFLNYLMEYKLEIDVFEKSEIGGRLATVKCGSEEYETGGSVIHTRNLYMTYFTKTFGLNKIYTGTPGTMIIVDGKDSLFELSNWGIWTIVKAFWRYRCAVFQIPYFLNNMLDSFDRIYGLQSDETSYETVRELLNAMDPSFADYQCITTYEGFSKYAGVNDRTILELIQATLKVNYGQTVTVPMFVGAVSLSSAIGGVWSVEGGNKLIAEKCLQSSEAKLHNYEVTQIIRNEKEDKFNIVAENDKGTEISLKYDIVVIAAPITADMKSKIKFINFKTPIEVKGRYQKTVATILKGNLKETVLNDRLVDNVKAIINLDEDELYSSISKIKPTRGTNLLDNNNTWKIFSKRKLTDNEIGDLFDDAKKVAVFDWLAYPQYKQLNRRDSFILDDKLYYINAIEWAASAMEMSVISARNVALLIQKYYREQGLEIEIL